jgi:hypothetical protein
MPSRNSRLERANQMLSASNYVITGSVRTQQRTKKRREELRPAAMDCKKSVAWVRSRDSFFNYKVPITGNIPEYYHSFDLICISFLILQPEGVCRQHNIQRKDKRNRPRPLPRTTT